MSVEIIEKWIEHEKDLLQRECTKHDIIFAIVGEGNDPIRYISEQIVAPLILKAERASRQALISAVQTIPEADVHLLVDEDGTLCGDDTGTMFFAQNDHGGGVLNQIFPAIPHIHIPSVSRGFLVECNHFRLQHRQRLGC